MYTFIAKLRKHAKLMVLLAFYVSLIWSIVPGTSNSTQDETSKLFEKKSELVIHQLFETAKTGAEKTTINDFFFTRDGKVHEFIVRQTTSLIVKSFAANSFERNVFYVYTSINAP